jgi:sugar/nucleoside kinase (ribokinase family)
MERAGMDVRFVDAVPGRPTLLSVCFQYPDGSGGNVTSIDSAASLVRDGDIDVVERWLSPSAIALAAPEVPLPVRRHLLRRATEKGALRVASLTTAEIPQALETGFLSVVDLLSLNEDEAAAVVGQSLAAEAPEPVLGRLAEIALAAHPGMRLIVTAGAHGAFAFDGSWTHVPTLPVRLVSSAGAGDALLGGVLAGLAAGLPFAGSTAHRATLASRPLASALDLGALVAAFKVTSPHTIPPDLSLDAVLDFARDNGVTFGDGLRRLLPAEAERAHAH